MTLYIPVCICLRPAHGMRLWFPSVTIKSITKIPEDKKGVFLILFSFRDIWIHDSRASLLHGTVGRVQCFPSFSSSLK